MFLQRYEYGQLVAEQVLRVAHKDVRKKQQKKEGKKQGGGEWGGVGLGGLATGGPVTCCAHHSPWHSACAPSICIIPARQRDNLHLFQGLVG